MEPGRSLSSSVASRRGCAEVVLDVRDRLERGERPQNAVAIFDALDEAADDRHGSAQDDLDRGARGKRCRLMSRGVGHPSGDSRLALVRNAAHGR
jgi:hypothetical protein